MSADDYAPPTVEDLEREDDEDDYDLRAGDAEVTQ